MVPEILATLAGGMFAGAAVYISLVEHPARLSCGVKLALTEWKPSYKRGTVMQASLAVIGSLFAALSWGLDKNAAWLIGGVLLLAVVPFTLIVIFPTNKKLESDKPDSSSTQTEHHLRLWGKLHAVRSLLSFLAFVIFLIALRHQPEAWPPTQDRVRLRVSIRARAAGDSEVTAVLRRARPPGPEMDCRAADRGKG